VHGSEIGRHAHLALLIAAGRFYGGDGSCWLCVLLIWYCEMIREPLLSPDAAVFTLPQTSQCRKRRNLQSQSELSASPIRGRCSYEGWLIS